MKGPDLQIWYQIESILEAMTDQPPSEKKKDTKPSWYVRGSRLPIRAYISKREPRSWFRGKWSPNQRFPMPRFAIGVFNDLAEKNPVSLKLIAQKSKSGQIEVIPGHEPSTLTGSILLFLWQYYFKDNGWERLKRCPTCKKWFVDETKNKSKERCSNHCTWLWWTRSRRKEAGHGGRRNEKRRGGPQEV